MIVTAVVLALVIGCTMLFIQLKTERDVNEVLSAKIFRRLVVCP